MKLDPQDLRAILASIISSGPGQGFQQSVERADEILAEVERTAKLEAAEAENAELTRKGEGLCRAYGTGLMKIGRAHV